tara:strand:- start:54 stop:431 length:378 start_codon:yes stop_codon:yes gene_type:complete
MHLGGGRARRVLPVTVEEAVVEEAVVEEEIFNPEAAMTDGNPFPEELIDYNSLTVEELRALCRARDLTVTGKKAELVARLLEADAPSEEAVEVTEDAPSEEAASSDETGSVSNESETETAANTVG